MAGFDIDPDDMARASAIGAAASDRRRRRRSGDEDDDYDHADGKPSSSKSLWLTAVAVFGTLGAMLALLLTFAT
ncbi:MAG: hypothetical protein AAFQ45_15370 [Pseudomonadota bacterium]